MDQPTPPKAPPITPGEIPTSGPTKTSVMAIASLVLGVLGFCTLGLGGLIGVILGIVALVGINKSAGRLGGQGLAIGGIVVSGTGLIVGIALPSPWKTGRMAISLSTGYEYNLSQREADITFDVSVGYAF